MKRKTSAVATLDIYLTYKSIDRKRDTWLEWRNSSLFLWSSSRDCEISKMRFNLEKSPVWTRELSNAISGARARSNIIVFIYEDTSVICLNLSWKYLCEEITMKKVCSEFYYCQRRFLFFRHSSDLQKVAADFFIYCSTPLKFNGCNKNSFSLI